MINDIEYGTSIPYHAEILWFSPDLRVPPTRLAQRSNGEQEIFHQSFKLVATKEGDVWKTKRE
ncbi:MAG: hypothetical protein HY043_18295 [Verrucomicrobia bacterium]|nr:hypothetical protein [Verrucomicrobiota bacterium]